jgi:hypothetical protein
VRASQVKAQNNWVFLKLDPRRVKVGLIELPTQTGVEKVGYSTAHVLSVGAGTDEVKLKKRMRFFPQQSLEPGSRVIIRDFHRDFHRIEVADEGYHFLLHFDDIEAVIEEDVVIGEWSEIRNETG